MEITVTGIAQISTLELYTHQEIVSKDPRRINRIQTGLRLARATLGVQDIDLASLEEERGRGLVNQVFFVHTNKDLHPDGVMLLMNPERKGKQAFERTFAAYKLLQDKLSSVSDGSCRVPNVLGTDMENQILIIEPLDDNVSWSTPTPILDGMCRSFIALSKIKPTRENRVIFPYDPIDEVSTPELFIKNVIDKRFSGFFEWYEKLRKGELGESESEAEEYRMVLKFIDDNRIVAKLIEAKERIEEKIAHISVDAFKNMPDIGFNTGDGNALNFLTSIDGDGNLLSGNIDFDDARFSSISELVASAVLHPQNIKLFEGSGGLELKKQLIENYISTQGFDEDQIKTFNLYLDLYWLKWCGTVAKNLSSGRANWQQLYGGSFKTRAEFLLKKDLPMLVDMLNTDLDKLYVNNDVLFKPFNWDPSSIKILTYPLTGKPPFGEFQIYVSEKVSDGNRYLTVINEPILKRNLAYPFTKKNVFYDHNPYLLGRTKKIVALGDGDFLVVHDFWSLRSKGETGEYSYLMRSTEKDINKGGLVFCVGEEEIAGQKISEISVPEGVLNKFIQNVGSNSEKRFRNLINVFKKLTNTESEMQVTELEIVRDADRFMTIVVATLNNGQKLTIKLNRENRVPEDSAGVVFVPRTVEGKYLFVRQRRLIVPSDGLKILNSSETLEASRGWISPDEQPLAEFAHEFGLKAGYTLKEGAAIPQDFRTDSTNLSVYLIEVDNRSLSGSFPKPNGTDEFHEELTRQDLTAKETVEAIKKGIIRDNFSIYSIGLYMLRSTNELIIDNDLIVGKNVYLQKRFVLQEGDFKYSIPEGPKNTGRLISENLPNSASARQTDQVNELGLEDLKKLNIDGLESVSVAQAIENIKDGVYDAPTAAALIVGFLDKGFIKYVG